MQMYQKLWFRIAALFLRHIKFDQPFAMPHRDDLDSSVLFDSAVHAVACRAEIRPAHGMFAMHQRKHLMRSAGKAQGLWSCLIRAAGPELVCLGAAYHKRREVCAPGQGALHHQRPSGEGGLVPGGRSVYPRDGGLPEDDWAFC